MRSLNLPNFKALVASFAFIVTGLALFALGLPTAHADSVTLPGTTLTVAKPTPVPTPAPVGLTIKGWETSSSIGQGYNTGGDGKGTVDTFAGGAFKLSSESYMTGNSNPNCTADCKSTSVKLGIVGEQVAGANSKNQGTGNSPVSSVAGTNGAFVASVGANWIFTPTPTQPPIASPQPAQPGTNVPKKP